MKAHNWREQAACQHVIPDLFYPQPTDTVIVRQAKQVCSTCPVKLECLETALRDGEQFGIWGGLTAEERRQLLRKRLWEQRRSRWDADGSVFMRTRR